MDLSSVQKSAKLNHMIMQISIQYIIRYKADLLCIFHYFKHYGIHKELQFSDILYLSCEKLSFRVRMIIPFNYQSLHNYK